jgi:hypothetical protein
MWKLCILLLILVIIYVYYYKTKNMEGFNEQTGTFCYTCQNKTPNQCLHCFNCGFCIDEFGNSKCVGGDQYGPFNYEKCAYWYYGDPYSKMIQNNDNYKCSYGPKSANRIIGV